MGGGGGELGLGTVCQLIAVNFPLRLPIEINLQICTELILPRDGASGSQLWVHFHLYLDFESLCPAVHLQVPLGYLRPLLHLLCLSVCLFVGLFTCGTFKFLLPRYTCPTWHNRFLKLFRNPKTLKNTTYTHTHTDILIHTGTGRHTHAYTTHSSFWGPQMTSLGFDNKLICAALRCLFSPLSLSFSISFSLPVFRFVVFLHYSWICN